MLAGQPQVDAAACLGAANLPPDALLDPEWQITYDQFDRFATAVIKELGIKNSPSRLADLVWDSGGGDLLASLRYRRNLHEMLESYARFSRLNGDFAVSVRMTDDGCQLCQPMIGAFENRIWISFANLILLIRHARQVTQRTLQPRKVVLAFDPRLDPALQDIFAGVPVVAGDSNCLIFAKSDCNHQFLTWDDSLFRGIEGELNRRLQRLDGNRDTEIRLRKAVRDALPHGEIGLADLAGKLGIGARTLQRRLNDNGTSFAKVIDDERRLLVESYMAAGSLARSEIAFRVGYRDLNSLYRALKRWQRLSA